MVSNYTFNISSVLEITGIDRNYMFRLGSTCTHNTTIITRKDNPTVSNNVFLRRDLKLCTTQEGSLACTPPTRV